MKVNTKTRYNPFLTIFIFAFLLAVSKNVSCKSLNAPTAFQTTNAELNKILKTVPILKEPVDFPYKNAGTKDFKKQAVSKDFAKTSFCNSPTFNCKFKEDQAQFFATHQIQISEKAHGMIYFGLGNQEVQIVLVTYNPEGKMIQNHVLAASYGDFEWGYLGSIEKWGKEAENSKKVTPKDWKITQEHFVWVNAEEKEFVKSQTFVIRANGVIDLVIAP